MSESSTETQPESQTAPEGGEQPTQAFTQADIDKAIDGVVARERKKHAAEIKELRTKAEAGATAEERIAALENDLNTTRHEAMKRRVQAAHGISDEDADLFLTGADEDALTAQATRLAARITEQQKNGNHVPTEGKNPTSTENEDRQFVRKLFGG